jgi:phosphatidylinositol 4-kinase
MSICLRLKNSESIIKEVSTQIRLNPAAVADLPQALSYLVTTETLLSDAPEVSISVIVLSTCF